MDNVEVYNCSQYDTLKAALRFDGANNNFSSITNSSVYLGWGMGVSITGSSNIFIQNTNFFSFVRFGVLIQTGSWGITFDNNILVKVMERGLVSLDSFIDISGGFIGCGAVPNDKCSYTVTNNIVAGVPSSGYVVYGHPCGNYNQ